ncbi:hypothetical protein CAL7716_018060 [Calothrix sp. PCC 7716]|nr:hypothetical protein CAL7716_018060 [Calothrix sp. PCC 7716]
MGDMPLKGKKIGVLVENEFIPEEIQHYQQRFTELGATVHLMSRLWGNKTLQFFSDIEIRKPIHHLDVSIDFQDVNLKDYAAVIMAANYTSVRLRHFDPPEGKLITPEQARYAPAVEFFAKAMADPSIIKGALCHGLWILTPRPETLLGRKVICHEVVLADIANAGAIYTPSKVGVVTDNDLVTGRSKEDVALFVDTITQQILETPKRKTQAPVKRTKELTMTEGCKQPELALLAAVEANDLLTVTDLIKSGINVNKRGHQHLTPLMIAAGYGYVQMTEKLLLAGADVNLIDSSLGASALHKAAQGGVVDVARLLLQYGAFINLQSAVIGNTPLIDAVWSKRPAMVKFLLDQGAIINIKNHIGVTVLDFIGDKPNWTAGGTIPENENWGKLIRTYLEERQKQNDAVIKEQRLMQAVQNNDLAAVKTLIAKGADVNEQSPIVGSGNDGQTPLLVASFNGYTEIVRELLNAGANPLIVDYIMKATPAHKAAFSRHAEVVKLLIEQDHFQIDSQGPYNGYTELHDAVWHGSIETVKVLLDANASLDLRGHDGKTPLEIAITHGRSEIAELIREKMSH